MQNKKKIISLISIVGSLIVFGFYFKDIQQVILGESQDKIIFDKNGQVANNEVSTAKILKLKYAEFSTESIRVDAAAKVVASLSAEKNVGKMVGALNELLNATNAYQSTIDKITLLSKHGISLDIANNEKEKQAENAFFRILEVENRYNKKLNEIATFGLTIDWEFKRLGEASKLREMAIEFRELQVIANERDSIKAEIQKNNSNSQ